MFKKSKTLTESSIAYRQVTKRFDLQRYSHAKPSRKKNWRIFSDFWKDFLEKSCYKYSKIG